ncbi:MarR family transcriptional regulator [Methanobacterium sp.]|uniref:MarR family winged helix-turn-helix transcriptional regulator n=1 Tax=Methanobacterium sp. TaxID=2164 RepID=UPI0026015040|nr:MarR family transcriptional regulator [Methanobacterium sp.]MBI5460161.1 MarR family transcriptional regulator [Methanobacterium sp.]
MDDAKLIELIDAVFLFHYPHLVKKLFASPIITTEIPFSHCQTLILLRKFEMLSISEIRNVMNIKKQNMTYIINKLENKRLIQRLPDLNDRRLVKIKITDEGEEYINQWQINAVDNIKKNLSTLCNEDLELLLQSIKTIKIVLLKLSNDREFKDSKFILRHYEPQIH